MAGSMMVELSKEPFQCEHSGNARKTFACDHRNMMCVSCPSLKNLGRHSVHEQEELVCRSSFWHWLMKGCHLTVWGLCACFFAGGQCMAAKEVWKGCMRLNQRMMCPVSSCGFAHCMVLQLVGLPWSVASFIMILCVRCLPAQNNRLSHGVKLSKGTRKKKRKLARRIVQFKRLDCKDFLFLHTLWLLLHQIAFVAFFLVARFLILYCFLLLKLAGNI